MRNRMATIAFLTVLLAAAWPLYGQQEGSRTKPMRTEIIKLKYVGSQDLQKLLYPYLSPWGRFTGASDQGDILVVSDYPENVDRILAAVKQIDVKPADILFTVQLVLGSETEEKTDPDLQNDPIIKEIRKLLRYRGYSLLDTSLIRAVDKEASEVVLGRQADFVLSLRPVVVKEEKGDLIQIELRLVQLARPAVPPGGQAESRSKDLIRSHLSLRSGDKTVVGVSKLDGGEKGLVLIISGKVEG